jgi:hypothetical protein
MKRCIAFVISVSCLRCNAFVPLSLRTAVPSSSIIPSQNASIRRAYTKLKISKGNISDSIPSADSSDFNDLNPFDKRLGILVLLTVPLSWGTYAPIVKSIYEVRKPIRHFVFDISDSSFSHISYFFSSSIDGSTSSWSCI